MPIFTKNFGVLIERSLFVPEKLILIRKKKGYRTNNCKRRFGLYFVRFGFGAKSGVINILIGFRDAPFNNHI